MTDQERGGGDHLTQVWQVRCVRCGWSFWSASKRRGARRCPNKANHDAGAKIVRWCDRAEATT